MTSFLDLDFLNKTRELNDSITLTSCDNDTCHNGGSCKFLSEESYQCQCPTSYTGK